VEDKGRHETRRDLRKKLKLYVITDPELSRGRSYREIVKEALQGGATAVQFRDKTLSTRGLVDAGKELRQLTWEYEALFVVNDRLDVALAVNADGIHIGQEDMPLPECRRILGDKYVIGVSAGNVEEAKEAEKLGADYLGSGPVYLTSTKNDAGSPLGVEGLAEICRDVELPVVGIGGIEAGNAREVIRVGAVGVAVISAVVSAGEPREACREFREKMGDD